MKNAKKKQIVQATTKVWLELELDAHNDANNEIPIIYMDESLYVDWREEGDESFWHETKTVFQINFNHTQENEIEDLVIDGIDDYLNEQEINNR